MCESALLWRRGRGGTSGGTDHRVRATRGSHVPDTITITDDRTGKTVTVPIEGGVFPSSALRELDPTLYCYDPAYLSTASCKSAITYLDGDAGILRYGGYPIEQLAGALDVPRGRLSAVERRAAEQAAARHVGRRRHASHLHPREHAQAVRRRLPLRRPSDGDVHLCRRGPRHLLRRLQGHRRPGTA